MRIVTYFNTVKDLKRPENKTMVGKVEYSFRIFY